MVAIAFNRLIGPVPISCVVREKPVTELEITEIPVEFGAAITDHAYPLPKKVTLEVVDAGAAATFAALVRFQESRQPFTLVTGLSIFRNMLVKRIEADRDKDFSTVLRATIDLQEVIIVETARAAGSEGAGTSQGSGSRSADGGSNSQKTGAGRSGDSVTSDRASGPITRGDARATPVPAPRNRTILRNLLGE